MGGAYDLPHAQLHAIVLPHVVALMERQAPELMDRVAGALGQRPASLALHSLLAQVPGPHALRGIGLGDDDLDDAVQLVTDALDLDEAEQILRGAHAGRAPQPGQPAPVPLPSQ
jgi:maleylacetate reductase